MTFISALKIEKVVVKLSHLAAKTYLKIKLLGTSVEHL